MPYPSGQIRPAHQVALIIQLDPSGTVVEVAPDPASDPDDPFVAAALESAPGCIFEPALEQGRPIAVELPFGWHFPDPPLSISGTVRAMGSGTALPGIQLRIGDRVFRTDDAGRFTLSNLPPGSWEVASLQSAWAEPAPERIELPPDSSIEVELWLKPEGANDELVVRYDPWDLGLEPRSMTREEAQAVPGSLGDPVRALHSRPGLTRTPFDAGWLLVRGGDYDDTGIFLEGVPMPLLYHLGGFTSVLHPEMTDGVAYWPGLQPSRYQATSGAVDVTARDLGDQRRLSAGMNTVFAHAFAEVPARWGGVAFAARRSWLDGVLALVLDPESARIAPRFLDAQVHVQAGEVDILAIALSDSFDAPSSTAPNDLVTVTQDGVQVQGSTRFDVGEGQLLLSPWVAHHIRSIRTDSGDTERLAELFPGLRVEWSTDPRAEVDANIGAEVEPHWFRVIQGYQGRSERTVPAITADPYASVGAGRELYLELGGRLDTSLVADQPARWGLSPRSRVRWKSTEHLALVAELGRTHRAPQATLVVGVPEGAYLPMERSDTVAAGVRWHRGPLTANLDGYVRQLAGVATVERDGSLVAGLGSARGVEAEARWSRGDFDLGGLVQLSESWRREDSTGPRFRSPLDQPIRAELLAVARLPRRWTLSSRIRATSGFSRRDGVPAYALDLLRQEEVDLGLRPSAPRLQAFYAIDGRAAHRILFRTATLDIWLDVQNVTNRRVPEPLITGFGESLPEYGIGLPILPIFGIELTWWRSGEPDQTSERQARESATSAR